MVLQIAESGGVALFAGEEVLVDAQHLRANGRMILAGATLQAAQEIALYGGRSDALPPSQPAPVNAVQVLLKDHLLSLFLCHLPYHWLSDSDIHQLKAVIFQEAGRYQLQLEEHI